MNIYIYSDESGVFDYIHNKYYVFAGVIILGDEEHDYWRRKYATVEKEIRNATSVSGEIKATTISNKHKNKIFRSLNKCHKFACIITEENILTNVWGNKKDKQRYLDYAFKIAVKRALEELLRNGTILESDVDNIIFKNDEHTTATNGRYELREALEQELKNGTYNYTYSRFFPPLFPKVKSINLSYCNSSNKKNRLIRAADIVANTVYYRINNDPSKIEEIQNICITRLP